CSYAFPWFTNHRHRSARKAERTTAGVGPHESVFYPVAAIMVDSSANKRILADLVTNAGIRAMPGHHHGILVQGVQPLADRTLDLRVIAAPQVGTANATAEQGVAGNQQPGFGEPEAHRTGGMPRGMHGHPTPAGQLLVVLQPLVRRRHRLVRHTE